MSMKVLTKAEVQGCVCLLEIILVQLDTQIMCWYLVSTSHFILLFLFASLRPKSFIARNVCCKSGACDIKALSFPFVVSRLGCFLMSSSCLLVASH